MAMVLLTSVQRDFCPRFPIPLANTLPLTKEAAVLSPNKNSAIANQQFFQTCNITSNEQLILHLLKTDLSSEQKGRGSKRKWAL